jgi:hypothetical protein
VRVGDLHDAQRAFAAGSADPVPLHAFHHVTVGDDDVYLLDPRGERLDHADESDRVGKPRNPRLEAERDQNRPRKGEQRARCEERGRNADQDPVRQRKQPRTNQRERVQVHRRVQIDENRRHPGETRVKRQRDQRVESQGDAAVSGVKARAQAGRQDGE